MDEGYRGIKNIVFAGAGDWAQTVAYMLADPLRYEGTNKGYPGYKIDMIDQPKERIDSLQAVQRGDISLEEAILATNTNTASELEKNITQYVKCPFGNPEIKDYFGFHDLSDEPLTLIRNADLIVVGVSSEGFKYWSKILAANNQSVKKAHDEPQVAYFKSRYAMNTPVLILTKGLVSEGLVYPTDLLEADTLAETSNQRPTPIALAYGGTIGKQVRNSVYSQVNIGLAPSATRDVKEHYLELLTDVMSVKNFIASRVENNDTLLMQVGASAKNIYALAFGMFTEITKLALQDADNVKQNKGMAEYDFSNLTGAFQPRAQKELATLYYTILRSKFRTLKTLRPIDRFSQPSFFGDLATTMQSNNSRNFRAGAGIAQAYDMRQKEETPLPDRRVIDQVCADIKEVVEGIRATEMYYRAMSNRMSDSKIELRLPVLYYTHKVVAGEILPHRAVDIILKMPNNKSELKKWKPNGL